MAITPVAYSSGSTSGAQTSVTVTLPAGWSAGDVCVVHINLKSGTDVTAATGWTSIISSNVASVYFSHAFYRVLQSGDTNPAFTISLSTGNGCAWVAADYSGVASTSTINASGQTSSSSNATTHLSPTITTTVANCMLLMLYGTDISVTYSSPSEGTLEKTGDAGIGSNADGVTSIVDFALGAAGATGQQSITVSSTCTYTGIQVALAPGAAPASALAGGGSYLYVTNADSWS